MRNKLEKLNIEWFSLIINAMLYDGAENTDMSIISVHDDEMSTLQLCGYGDDDDILSRGMYLLIWDSIDENDERWAKLYDVLNKENFPNECWDILLPCNDDDIDDQCVLIFKLSDSDWQL